MIPFKTQLKALWELRFKRILILEKESFDFYQELLVKNSRFLEGTKAKEKLEILMKDERRHARAAERLLHFLDRKAKKTNGRHEGNASGRPEGWEL